MSNVIPFSDRLRAPEYSNRNNSVDLEAAVAVGRYLSLRQGPAETPGQFVARIVRAYKAEGGK